MKRPVICFLTHSLTDIYGQILLAGISDGAREHDVNIYCYVGRDLNSPRSYDAQSNKIYSLASKNKVDGIIFSGGIVSNFASNEQVQEFYNRYPDLPKVSIAVPLKGVPSVLINNAEGMKSLLRHLIKVHGYRKIAYINGPRENLEVSQRYQAYCAELKNHGIQHNPDLVVDGDFEPRSGFMAVHELLDQRKADIEVIIAANDNMALGAMEALIQRGVSVPDEIAVAGFDDLSNSVMVTPPLTTVRQPIYQMARKATDLIVDQIVHQKEVPPEYVFPTECIIRESCGCFPFVKNTIRMKDSEESPIKEALLNKKLPDLLDSLEKSIQDQVSPANKNRLRPVVHALLQDLQDHSATNFIQSLNLQLRETVFNRDTLSEWPLILTVIREQMIPRISDRAKLIRITGLLDQARQLILDTTRRILSFNQAVKDKEANIIRDVSETLMMNFNLEKLTDLLRRELHRLGIDCCYLVLYEDIKEKEDSITSLPQWSRLRLAFHSKQEYRISKAGIRFRSNTLIPARYLPADDRFTMIIEPLYFRKVHFGYIVFGAVPQVSGNIYEALRGQISSALMGTQLFQDLYQAKQEIEAHVKKLQQSNEALEQFAYVTSHDLQEPLRMISSYGGLLERNIHEILDPESEEFLYFMMDGAKRMQRLIQDLLIYSRVTSRAKPMEDTDLNVIVNQALSNLKVMIEEKHAIIKTNRLPRVMCDPVQMERIFQNLISNAIKYSEAPPKIQISAKKTEPFWTIHIQDNGIGIDPKFNDKIFGIFQRLHHRNEYSGTGIGLAVCKKIVERHGGKIWVESKGEGKGSTFKFTVPMH